MKKHIGIIAIVTLFISIISIVAILIARGYNFSENELKENGILEILSVPEDSTIFIDGEEKGKTPKKFELLTGSYELKVEKEGYTMWQKKVVVDGSIVTTVNASLYPIEKKLEQITFVDVDKAFFSKDGDIAIYTISSKNNPGIWTFKIEKTIFELASAEPQKIADINIIPKENREKQNYDVIISPDNSKALFVLPGESAKEYFLIDLNDTSKQPTSLNKKLNFNPTNVLFSHNPEQLLVIDEATISQYDTKTKKLSLLVRQQSDNKSQLVLLANEKYLLLDYNYKNGKKQLWQLDKEFQKNIITLPEDIDIQEITSITATKDNEVFIAFATPKNAYIYNITKPNVDNSITQIAKSKISFTNWSPDGSSLLFVQDGNLKSVNISKRPDGTHKTKVSTVVKDYSPDQYTVHWSSNSSQLIINDLKEGQISTVDKDGENSTLLYEGELTYSSAYTLSKNSTFLVMLLKDSKEYSNLYTITLKI